MYFRLYNHCKLVEGAKCGAIYNLQSGEVLSVNQGAVKLLKECQINSLDKIIDLSAPQNRSNVHFLNSLVIRQLGSIYLMEPKQPDSAPLLADEQKLFFILLEITDKCNNSCLHCYTTSSPRAHQAVVPHERWLSVISEARQAGARSIQIIGGEPLLYPKWRELVLKARKDGFEAIEIFTNATLITDSDIDFFKEQNVGIATSIYAGTPGIHDTVTLNPGSFDKTVSSIKKILAKEIPLRISSVIMTANENEAEQIIELCTSLGITGVCPTPIRPVGRGADDLIQPENYTRKHIKPPFYTDENSFARAHYYHNCLAGKITITYTGDAIPCMFARNQIYGNILEGSLNKLLISEKLQRCWHTTKDQVNRCKDCEFRYACYDCRCRPDDCSPEESWPECPLGCSYDPYSGKWTDLK